MLRIYEDVLTWLEELAKVVAQPPRYDDVFFKGLSWLDELGSGGEGQVDGEAEFDDEVWRSDTRGEDRE